MRAFAGDQDGFSVTICERDPEGRSRAPLLVYSGDLMTRSLGQENLATKIFSIAVVGALAALLAVWLRRQFHT